MSMPLLEPMILCLEESLYVYATVRTYDIVFRGDASMSMSLLEPMILPLEEMPLCPCHCWSL